MHYTYIMSASILCQLHLCTSKLKKTGGNARKMDVPPGFLAEKIIFLNGWFCHGLPDYTSFHRFLVGAGKPIIESFELTLPL